MASSSVPIRGVSDPRWAWWAAAVRRLDAVREVLTSDGRTLAQGAVGWLWAVGDNTIPIPGFKGLRQAEENAGALEFGPLPPDRMAQVDALLKHDEVG